MAPTTIIDQVSETSPQGRDPNLQGYPVRMAEMLATLDGAAYIARVSVHNPQEVLKAKKAIKKAFELQIAGRGFTLVEVLSTCSTNWGYSPKDSLKWLADKMIPVYPLGVKKAPEEGN